MQCWDAPRISQNRIGAVMGGLQYLEGVVLRARGHRDPGVVPDDLQVLRPVAGQQLGVVPWQAHIGRGTPLHTQQH